MKYSGGGLFFKSFFASTIKDNAGKGGKVTVLMRKQVFCRFHKVVGRFLGKIFHGDIKRGLFTELKQTLHFAESVLY